METNVQIKIKNIIIIILSLLILTISILFGYSLKDNKTQEELINKYELQIEYLKNNSIILSKNIQEYQDSINKLKINIVDLNKEKDKLHERLNQPIYSKTFNESVILLKLNLENEKALNNTNH